MASGDTSCVLSSVTVPGGGSVAIIAFPGFNNRTQDIIAYGKAGATDVDLRRVRAWGATILLSLVEQREMERVFRLPDLGARASSAGLQFLHCPIADMDRPDDVFEARWRSHWPLLEETLRAGGQIAVHCAAGQGRAGTIAARILIAFGVSPDDAIASVRQARPRAIESETQERYLRALTREKALPAPPPRQHQAARNPAGSRLQFRLPRCLR